MQKSSWLPRLITAVAISMSVYQIYISLSTSLSLIQQRAIHLAFGLVLTFLLFPARKGWEGTSKEWFLKALFLVLSLAPSFYIVHQAPTLVDRFGFATAWDVLFGAMLIVVSLEATRRIGGAGLAVIAVVFIIYAFAGPVLPGLLQHSEIRLSRFISYMFLTTEGLYGSILGVSATFAFMFILFGAFLNESGAGAFYTNFAVALLGKIKGGPSYVAVMASALLGMISGSGVANAATTGVFTIPLMKRVGFSSEFAGAVEALSSTGGQIMPPIMGAAAFIMSDVLGTPYSEIIKAAFIPAVLFFASIFMMIYFETQNLPLKPIEQAEIPRVGPMLRSNFHHFLPPLVLVVLLTVFKYTALRAALITIGFVVLISWLSRASRMNLRRILKALEDGARGALLIVAVTAVAGLVVGIINLTGIGLQLSSILISVAGNSVALLLILTMLSSIVLGMGLPTTATYIILAILVAPALVDMGVRPLAAHLFVLYFGVLALVTPPIAGGVYITAGIAKGNTLKTGLKAMQLGIAGYIVPFMFVQSDALLMIGSLGEVLMALGSALLGTLALAAGVQGFLLDRLNWGYRVLLVGTALLLIKPGLTTDLVGAAVLGLVIGLQAYTKRLRGEAMMQVETR